MTINKETVVIITGASSGIGEAAARAFGQKGIRLVLAARRIERLELLKREIISSGKGAEVVIVETDVTKSEDRENLVYQTIKSFGSINILINNAGIGRINWFEKLDPVDDVESQFTVNVMSVIQLTRLVIPYMMKKRSGHIINLSSVAGSIAMPTYTIYAASKFAINGFSEALRREMAPWGINVSTLYPGGVKTEFGSHIAERKTRVTTPSWLTLSAGDVATKIVELAQHPRPTVVIPWIWSIAMAVNAFIPGLVDWIAVNRFTKRERAQDLH